jgi:hypothetical protein
MRGGKMNKCLSPEQIAFALNNGGVIIKKNGGTRKFRLVQPGLARHMLIKNPHSSAAKSLNERIVAKELVKNAHRLVEKAVLMFNGALKVEDKKSPLRGYPPLAFAP